MKKLTLITILLMTTICLNGQRRYGCTVQYFMNEWSNEFEVANGDCVMLIEYNEYRKVYRSWTGGRYMFWYFKVDSKGLPVYILYKFDEGIDNSNNVNLLIWN